MLGAKRLEPDDASLEGRCTSTRPPHATVHSAVPIYEYACMECESHFDELVRSSEQAVTCPECGAANVLKQLSSFAVHGAASKPASAAPARWRRRLLRRLLRLRLELRGSSSWLSSDRVCVHPGAVLDWDSR